MTGLGLSVFGNFGTDRNIRCASSRPKSLCRLTTVAPFWYVGDQIDNDDKNIAEGGDEETDSLEEKISVNSDELASSDDKGSPKRRFGHEKNRWSIRRVFKKKSA